MSNIAAGKLLSQYGLLWQSLLTSTDQETKKELVVAMEGIRDQTGLDDAAWEEFTATLPGYDEWWMRIRQKYLAHLTDMWEQTKDDP